MSIETLLADMAKRGATDLYLSAGNLPLYRIDGTLYPASGTHTLTPQAIEALLKPHLTPGQWQAAWENSGIQNVNIRLNDVAAEGEVFPDGDRLAAAFHQIL